MAHDHRLGRIGIWSSLWSVAYRSGDPAQTGAAADAASEVEALGYGTIWQGGSPASDLGAAEDLLDGTESIIIATGIVNIWTSNAVELADSYHRIQARHPGRLLLGIGTGHREDNAARTRPVDAMSRYLDVLDERGVPTEHRVLSALGPRMLAMAAERSAGTHPYLTVPSQTRQARTALGSGALVAPEQTVVLDANPESARRTARAFLAHYLTLVNYTSNMRRAGLTAEDLANGGSDNLVDQIVAHGDASALGAAVRVHLDAGADHVCVQVQPSDSDVIPALRAIADDLRLRSTR